MIEKRFYHEVLTPYARLRTRCGENICVEPHYSDIVAQTQEVAIALYHFPEAINGKQPRMDDPDEEKLRQILRDVSDTKKHGRLRDPHRQTYFNARLAFEANDADQFRFLATYVVAQNKRHGGFNLSDVIDRYIIALCKFFSLQARIELSLPKHEFKSEVATYVASNALPLSSTMISIYKRNRLGQLLPYSPPRMRFVVYDLTCVREPR